jgi:hypothetical protein
MPHVTFIHGIANKAPKEKLLENWEAELAAGGLDLPGEGISTSMVYWADVMYPEPLAASSSLESVEDGLGLDSQDEELEWVEQLSSDEEKAFVASFRKTLGFDAASPGADDYQPPSPASNEDELEAMGYEAIPLPWFIKRRVMKRLLKDVHHYMFNAKFSPRPGEEYQVQDHIRRLFVEQLKQDSAQCDGAHVVVSHSMGTVISYDCLKNVADCPSVSGYMTLGSPLGISEVYDNFKPKYVSRDAFPSATVKGNWVNVSDRLDPVAFDAQLANDYLKAGHQIIIDQRVKNSGKWRHSSYKYFGQPALCEHLRKLLSQ